MYQVVVARGFARPAATVECAAPLLVHGWDAYRVGATRFCRSEGSVDVDVLASLGLELEYAEARTFRYAVLTLTGTCPTTYPCSSASPKRPLSEERFVDSCEHPRSSGRYLGMPVTTVDVPRGTFGRHPHRERPVAFP